MFASLKEWWHLVGLRGRAGKCRRELASVREELAVAEAGPKAGRGASDLATQEFLQRQWEEMEANAKRLRARIPICEEQLQRAEAALKNATN